MKWFKDNDFKCTCGCNKDIVDSLKQKMDSARDEADVPFVINSGARCEKHNAEVGGVKDSSHLKGLAVDIKCDTSDKLLLVRMIWALSSVGIRRFGIANNFIHIDIDANKPRPAFWKY